MPLFGPVNNARRRGRRRGLIIGAAAGSAAAKRSNKATHQPAAIEGTDVTKQLEELAKLKDKGILTQEEFDAKKKRLLGL